MAMDDDKIEMIGYDFDNDKVWQDSTGRVVGGLDTEAEARRAFASPFSRPFDSLAFYMKNFGAVTKEKRKR